MEVVRLLSEHSGTGSIPFVYCGMYDGRCVGHAVRN